MLLDTTLKHIVGIYPIRIITTYLSRMTNCLNTDTPTQSHYNGDESRSRVHLQRESTVCGRAGGSRFDGGDERIGLLLAGPELLGHLAGAADHRHDHLSGVGLPIRVLRVAHQLGQTLHQTLVVQPLTAHSRPALLVTGTRTDHQLTCSHCRPYTEITTHTYTQSSHKCNG